MIVGKRSDKRQIVQVDIDPLQEPGTSACKLRGETVSYDGDGWIFACPLSGVSSEQPDAKLSVTLSGLSL